MDTSHFAGIAASSPEASSLAYVSGQMKSGKLTVFDTQLTKLYLQNTPHAVDTTAFVAMTPDLANSVQVVGGLTYVTVDITARNGDGASMLPQLEALGLTDASSFKGVVSGDISSDKLEALRSFLAGGLDGKGDDIGFARASAFMTFAGATTTQADHAENADTARSGFSVDGTGIKVGILSDSFNTNSSASTHMAGDISSGDLPASTSILHDFAGGEDEGRAMAQIVHDIAPGASIAFDTAEGGQAAFANHIVELANAGAKVIVDDIIYFGELYYQEGPIAQAVDQVAASGVSYFSSAGNDSVAGHQTGYEQAWSSGGVYTGGGETTTLTHFSSSGQDYLPVVLGTDEYLVLQWSNPGSSAGGTGANADVDFFLTNQDGSVVNGSSVANNLGGDPVEVIHYTGSAQTLYLRVGLFAGPAPAAIKVMALGNGDNTYFPTVASAGAGTGTFYGHAAAASANGVAAAFYGDTPAFGTSPPLSEPFSSLGPDAILYDNAGNLLSSASARNVAFTAVDGGNTTFFGNDIGADADSFPNFFGTSAAAPGAASVAALMLQARSTLTPQDVRNLLSDSATDMGASGFDSQTGMGLIDANKAVGFASTLTIANAGQATLLGTHLNDNLQGSAGVDVIDGGAGNDAMDGGGGVDTASYASAPSRVEVSLALQGSAQATLGAGTDTLTNFENLTGSAFNDRLTGDGNDNVIHAGDGSDILDGGAGNDTLDGGPGADWVLYTSATSGVTVSLAIAGPQATGGDGTDTLTGIEHLQGSAFNDTLTGDAGNNVLAGVGGDDTLDGGAGNDTLDGGAGVNTASYASASSGVTVSLAIAGGQNTGGAGTDTLTSIQNLTGSGFNDTLTGDGGNNVLTGGAGNDALDGGGGTDTAAFSGNRASYTISLSGGVTTVAGPDGTDTLTNIEQLQFADQTISTSGGPINGTSGADVLTGTAGDDVINGLGGNDTISGLDGNDTLNGGPGNDSLNGGNGNDTADYSDAPSRVLVNLNLAGAQDTVGAGVDTLTSIENLTGSAFNDDLKGDGNANIIHAGDGSDVLDGGAGNDTLDGGPGADWVLYTSATSGVTVSLAVSGPQVTGGDGTDTLSGFEHMQGSAYNDVLTGDAGNNVLAGVGGDDTLDGGAGNDTLDGGAGNNTASYASATSGVTVSLAIAGGQNTGGAGTDTLTSIQNLTGSGFNDTLTGDGGANVLTGGGGNDLLAGGAGNDTAVFSGARASYTVSLSGGSVTVAGPDGTDTLTNIEHLQFDDQTIDAPVAGQVITGDGGANVLTGTAGDDTINGLGGNDTISGLDGADTLNGGPGNDSLDGGNGSDTADYSDAPSRVLVSLALAGAQDTVGAGTDTLTSIENLTGSAFNDQLTGDGNANVIHAGDGSDILVGGLGDDTLDGGPGADWVLYSGAPSGETVNLLAGTASGGEGNDTLTGIEHVLGSNFDDTITGDAGNNVLQGGSGADVIDGGLGNDTLDGGGGIDTVTYATAASAVTVDLGAGQATGGAGSDSLTGFENVTGSAFDDTLTGDGGNNTLQGGNGNDVLEGGLGNDTLNGAAGNDTADYSDAPSRVLVNLNLSGAQDTVGAGTDTLTSIENLNGSAFNDDLKGDGGNNIIHAGDGSDVVDGGAGNDTLDGGPGADWVLYTSATSGVTVSLAVSGPQVTGGDGTDTLSGFEHMQGSAFNDVLTGDAGNNVLAGVGGDDILDGGAGNDTLDGGAGVNTASYASATSGVTVSLAIAGGQNTLGAGTDTLTSIQNLAGSGFNDVLTGDGGNNVLTGGGGNDLLAGGAGNDTLDGGSGTDTASYASAGAFVEVNLSISGPQNTNGAGTDTLTSIENLVGSAFNDSLRGDSGNNVITGGGGGDALTGNGGNDTFVFNALSDSANSNDQITDFSTGDHIDLSAIDADTVTGGDQAFHLGGGGGHAGDIKVTYDPGHDRTEIDLYVDNNPSIDAIIFLSGNHTMTAGDFIL